MVKRRAALIIRTIWCVLWLVATRYVIQQGGVDALQLWLIASVMLLIVFVVYRPSWIGLRPSNKRFSDTGSRLSAYAFLNPNNERLSGETSLRAFGLPDVRDSSGPIRSSPSSTGKMNEDERRSAELSAEKDTGKLGRRQLSDLTEEEKILLAQTKLKLHHKCCCGSGKRFGACCEGLQKDLRQLGYR
jgi:hypothetical protein